MERGAARMGNAVEIVALARSAALGATWEAKERMKIAIELEKELVKLGNIFGRYRLRGDVGGGGKRSGRQEGSGRQRIWLRENVGRHVG